MRILILSSEHFVFEDENHPSGMFQRDLAKSYKALGHEVAVISFRCDPLRKNRPPELTVNEWGNIIVARGVNRKVFPERYLPFFIVRKIYERGYLKLFRRIENLFGEPDLIHAHNFEYAGFSSIKLASQTGANLLITEHSSRFLESGTDVFNAANRFLSRYPQLKVTAVSKSLNKALSKTLAVKSEVIPNPLDPLFLSETRATHVPGRFISIGSLRPIKNHKLLIVAFCKFRKISKTATLTIIGAGELSKELNCLIRENNASDFIEIIGPTSREKLKKIYNQADALLISSKFETFGVVAIEAMSCGLPVLSTRNGGVESIITSRKLGRTCRQDVEGFFEMLKDYDSGKFDRQQIKRHVCSMYDPHKISSQYLTFAKKG
jgi:glycosyltransferase involved in cell wall biosynthesis